MQIHVHQNQAELAVAAEERAATALKTALAAKPVVRIIAATGNAQLRFLERLCGRTDIDWSRIEVFHLDEYVGISKTHPASFAGYIERHIAERVHPRATHLIDGEATDVETERRRISDLVAAGEIDVAFVGIGENGHLAFNDPPADFETDVPFIVVELDHGCRRQQVGEGWFASLDDVPILAYTMSMCQILKSRTIICVVPEVRKAKAVRDCLRSDAPVSPAHPASLLKTHNDTYVHLDLESASLLPDGENLVREGTSAS